MSGLTISRRSLGKGLLALGATSAAPLNAAVSRITARDIVDRIKAQCAREGVKWSPQTVDTWKIGDPDRAVTGVVTTFMATLPLMRRAVAAGANFIVSHEPVFYSHGDETESLQQDPVYQAKVRYITRHGLIVWRFHDHLHALKPDPMSTASTNALGWNAYLDPNSKGFGRRFDRPAITLAALTEEIAARLPSRSIRVIGDPGLSVRSIINAGHSLDGVIRALEQADVAIGPEVREFDSAEYLRDLLRSGRKKALILLAHERGEEGGMRLCETWIRPLVPEVPVRFLSSGEPFRTPV